MEKIAPLLFVLFLLPTHKAVADPIVFPLPLDSPVSVDLSVHPVVTIGERTVDFTPFLNQEFINFLWAVVPVSSGWRHTIGLRARDGLTQLTGSFPPSPDPMFVNQVPMFTDDTRMNLLAFDVIIPTGGIPFSVSFIDTDGDARTAEFASPVPEPASLLLVGSGLALLARARRRGKRPV